MDPAAAAQELLAASEAMEGQPIQGSLMEQPRCSWRRASLPILLMTLLMGVGIAFSVKKGSADLSLADVGMVQRAYKQLDKSNARFVEQPMSKLPGMTDLQMSLQMLGLESEGTHVTGHLVKVNNPIGRVSIVLPPGGCGTREKTSVTAQTHNPKCRLAVNAGYFNVHTDACIGNVVSEGVVIQTVPLAQSNVNFGINKDDKFAIGYFTPEELRGFRHLVSGVTWLVRDGKSYVEKGWNEANISVQTSGDKYVTNLASRTAGGVDQAGRLIIIQIDGSIAVGDKKRGVNMYELADLMIKHGAVHAVNLDGGGSSAMVRDGALINYLSDTKPPSCDGSGDYQCERPVSTILCIHESAGEYGSVTSSSSFSFLAWGILIGGASCAVLAAVVFAVFRNQPSNASHSYNKKKEYNGSDSDSSAEEGFNKHALGG